MNSISDLVEYRYRRLIVDHQPNLAELLSKVSLNEITGDEEKNDNDKKDISSKKILNGPPMSRENNESDVSQNVEVSFVVVT